MEETTEDTTSSTKRRNQGGGPTTEAGRERLRQAQAAKEAKQERRREKNRQKRHAYRERHRDTYGTASSRGRYAWSKHNHKDGSKKDKNEKKGSKSTTDNTSKDKERQQMWRQAKRGNTEAWETLLNKALSKHKFGHAVELFVLDLKLAASATTTTPSTGSQRSNSDVTRAVWKRYRLLSTRYHPDKHTNGSDTSLLERYTVAFQALNEAHDCVQQTLDTARNGM